MKTDLATRFVLVLIATTCAASPAWAIQPSLDDPHNSLSADKVNEAALSQNLALRRWLAARPLTTATIVGFADPHQVTSSADLLRYVATCALDDDSLPVTLPGGAQLKGQIGLCGATSPYGNWAAAPPSSECVHVVSSCVLALVNARGRKIPLSLRGFDTTQPQLTPLLGMRDKIRVERQYRKLPLQDIQSVTTHCAPNGDDRANCGWTPLYVGRCERRPRGAAADLPNPTVTLTIRKAGKPVDNLKIRVCKGLYACDYEACQPNNDSDMCKYSGHIKSSYVNGQSEITFACPANGPLMNEDQLAHRYGYYSVMLAPATSQPLDEYEIEARPEAQELRYDGYTDFAHYPAREVEVFTYREGAFYGNLFDIALPPTPQTPGTPTTDTALRLNAPRTVPRVAREPIYACWADGTMSQFISSMDARWCATSNDCFIGLEPVTCHDALPLQCGYAGDHNRGGFTQCVPDAGTLATPAIWRHPLTTYLNGPCDLAADSCNPEVNPTGGQPGGAPLRAPEPARPTSTRR